MDIDFEDFFNFADQTIKKNYGSLPVWARSTNPKEASFRTGDNVTWRYKNPVLGDGDEITATVVFTPIVCLDGNISVMLRHLKPAIVTVDIEGKRSFLSNPKAWVAKKEAIRILDQDQGIIEVEVTMIAKKRSNDSWYFLPSDKESVLRFIPVKFK